MPSSAVAAVWRSPNASAVSKVNAAVSPVIPTMTAPLGQRSNGRATRGTDTRPATP
ncbi:Uncharacterised protein [Mycobacterium tuberculosis]|uniref:Uncharacterized protein n=1 Tax=Mycobacterium tuberculosis TaxID=1773 RepID=A0A916PBZ3_MYCTX|nr:Uncharacterised protein [Mycobacterium tuberculosis]